MSMITIKSTLFLIICMLTVPGISSAQFMDSFDKDEIEGWFFFTGDGDATMDFIQKDNYARIFVDATEDRFNVWWAIIKRDISPALDLSKLQDPDYELRVEARVRAGDAPRRVNFMINTNRTTDFHKQLIEHEIPDTTEWHTISFTTTDLDVMPGDSLFVQFGVTDWGLETYYVDLDYYRADIVNIHDDVPVAGEPLIYHPPIPDIDTFSNQLEVTHDGLINLKFPEVNFNNWQVRESDGSVRVLTVHTGQWAVLRWDFDQYESTNADGAGLLELTTHSVSKGGHYIDAYGEDLGVEFGKIRVIEILNGDPDWDQNTVTYNSLMQDKSYPEVFNTQMIIDLELSEEPGSKTMITISRSVMQRLLDGTTKGLLIRPLGAINASFYATENETEHDGPRLHFNLAR
jgi:hypothetical protein